MLDVVNQQQQLPLMKGSEEGLERLLLGRLSDSQGAGDLRDDERRVAERREAHEDRAVRERGGDLTRNLECESRLPRPAGSRQYEKSHVVAQEKLAELGELPLTAHELARRSR